MELAVLIFLTSGIFLGWGLGANHLGNIFGTAIGARMLSWRTAAILCSIFVILGAVISGSGPAQTLGKLGAVNALGGAFVVAFGAGLSVYWMTKAGLPVSTTQAIIGAIMAWNFFSGTVTDFSVLTHILTGWALGPALAAVFAVVLMKLTTMCLRWSELHLLRIDAYTRIGLIVAGSFGAYSLGANNIANVMGVFVPTSPFTEFNLFGLATVTSVQQLFLVGGIAIAVGVMTYSHKVVHTVGSALFPMSPIAAWVVVMSHSLVLMIFASEGLEHLLASHGLPTFPLVPVSSSEVVIGAVIGIALMKGGKGARWGVLGRITTGWVATPFLSGIVCFIGLFVMQNMFDQVVYQSVGYELTPQAMEKIRSVGVFTEDISDMVGPKFKSSVAFRDALRKRVHLSDVKEREILNYTKVTTLRIDRRIIDSLDPTWFNEAQISALKRITGREYKHTWAMAEDLATGSPAWSMLPESTVNKLTNKERNRKLEFLYRAFSSIGK